MEGKKLGLAIIVIVIMLVLFFLFFAGYIFDLGYKVQINGQVNGPSLLNGDWSVTASTGKIEKDKSLLSLEPFIFGIGETEDVLVEASIKTSYSNLNTVKIQIGRLGDILGESRPFSLTFRRAAPGENFCTINVYEIEKGWFGLEEKRTLKASYEFSFMVGDLK